MSFVLAGNSKIRDTILNSLSENRLPHAIIIEGDSGTGKHTLAKFLAKAIVCENPTPPCNNCNNCHLADSSNHPDIIPITPMDGKKNIVVSQIRDIITQAGVKPHSSKNKVFVIDGAHTMNSQSQNILLKILEEPPQTVSFILITETKAALLDTVLSRCVLFSLSVPDTDSATKYLKKNTDFNLSEITSALSQSRNNIGKALALLKGEKQSADEANANEFIEFLLRGDSFGMLTICSKYEKNRIEAANFLKWLKLLSAQRLKENLYSKISKNFSSLYFLVSDLEYNINSNTNLGLLFTVLVSRAKNI